MYISYDHYTILAIFFLTSHKINWMTVCLITINVFFKVSRFVFKFGTCTDGMYERSQRSQKEFFVFVDYTTTEDMKKSLDQK